jgi:hypothetical protein
VRSSVLLPSSFSTNPTLFPAIECEDDSSPNTFSNADRENRELGYSSQIDSPKVDRLCPAFLTSTTDGKQHNDAKYAQQFLHSAKVSTRAVEIEILVDRESKYFTPL